MGVEQELIQKVPNEGVSKVQKNIENALKVHSAGVKSFNSFHQSIGVVTDKFLKLVAEETECSANEILKDT